MGDLSADRERRAANRRAQSVPQFARLTGCYGGVDGRAAAPPGQAFWPDDISLLDTECMDATRLLCSAQVTDSYLLALARAHRGQLASFDRRLLTAAVPEGSAHFHLID